MDSEVAGHGCSGLTAQELSLWSKCVRAASRPGVCGAEE